MVDLLKAPPFEALSYVWGGYHERGSLQINGHAIKIHEGLFNAIHALRYSTFERLVWADAICIIQPHSAMTMALFSVSLDDAKL
jgi:hypothetical protein